MKVYENDKETPLKPGDTDGMEDLIGIDTTPTDWDIDVEEPPHEFLKKGPNKKDGDCR